jgi:hypothetical protein
LAEALEEEKWERERERERERWFWRWSRGYGARERAGTEAEEQHCKGLCCLGVHEQLGPFWAGSAPWRRWVKSSLGEVLEEGALGGGGLVVALS